MKANRRVGRGDPLRHIWRKDPPGEATGTGRWNRGLPVQRCQRCGLELSLFIWPKTTGPLSECPGGAPPG